MTFLNPLDALIPKIPFSFFSDFWVWVTSEARGSVSVGFLGVPSIEPFLGEGRGVRPEGSIDPRPPGNENPASAVLCVRDAPPAAALQAATLVWFSAEGAALPTCTVVGTPTVEQLQCTLTAGLAGVVYDLETRNPNGACAGRLNLTVCHRRGRGGGSNNPGNNQHNPQYANYWAPLTRKRHIPPHPAQPQHTNDGAPRTRKRHQQEHRPQRPTEHSDPTQHAKGRTGDCPGPRKGATTRRNVTRGAACAGRRPTGHSICCGRRIGAQEEGDSGDGALGAHGVAAPGR